MANAAVGGIYIAASDLEVKWDAIVVELGSLLWVNWRNNFQSSVAEIIIQKTPVQHLDSIHGA